MAVRWSPELLRIRTATGEEGAAETPAEPAKDAPAKDAPAKETEKEKEPDLGQVRGLAPQRGEAKPVLVYFHWPHEDGDKGRRVLKFCKGPLDDEAFVRVSSLFHCVEINSRDSDSGLVVEAGIRTPPALLVCRPDGKVLWRSEEPGTNGRVLAETMKKVLKDRFPDAWEAVQKEAEAQKGALAEARKLVEAKKTDEAMGALGRIVDSTVRFTDEWAQAVKVYRELEAKAEEAREKERAK